MKNLDIMVMKQKHSMIFIERERVITKNIFQRNIVIFGLQE
jgi:hypothetical protein